jgi:hypothetical protein
MRTRMPGGVGGVGPRRPYPDQPQRTPEKACRKRQRFMLEAGPLAI